MTNFVKKSPGKGRGIFAGATYSKGETVEKSPAIILNKKDSSAIDRTLLARYVFGCGKTRTALGLGHTSLYNHSKRPNATYEVCSRSKTVHIWAVKTIKRGDEIFINYGYDPTKY